MSRRGGGLVLLIVPASPRKQWSQELAESRTRSRLPRPTAPPWAGVPPSSAG